MKKQIILLIVWCVSFQVYAQVPVIDGAHIATNEMSWTEQLKKALEQFKELQKENAHLNEYLNLYRNVSAAVRSSKKLQSLEKQVSSVRDLGSDMRNVKKIASESSYQQYCFSINLVLAQLDEYESAKDELLRGQNVGGILNNIDLGGNWGSIGNENIDNILGGQFQNIEKESDLDGFDSFLGGLSAFLGEEYDVDTSKMRMNDGERMQQLNNLIEKVDDLYAQLISEKFRFERYNNAILLLQAIK